MSMMVNPYMFGGVPIPYFSQEQATSTVSSSSLTTILTLAIDASELTANTDYFCIWSAETACANSATRITVAPFIDAVQQSAPVQQPVGSGKHIQSGIFRLRVGATPSSVNLYLKASNNSNVSTTITNARLIAVQMGSSDGWGESLSRSTTANSGTSWANKVTVSFTPPSTGNYLVIGSCLLDCSTSANPMDVSVRLSDGVTSNADLGQRYGNADVRLPRLIALPLTGASGPKSITMDFKQATGTGNTVGITDARILVLRLDRFLASHIAKLTADGTTTNASYSTAQSQTFTPNAGDHLTLACGMFEDSSTSAEAGCELVDGGTVQMESVRPAIGVTTNDASGLQFGTARIANYAASSRTQAINIKAASGATARLKRDFVIASIPLIGAPV